MSKRNYLILLLYEIQERIEEKHENGEISTNDAAKLIDTIIEIKRDILFGEPQSIIKSKIKNFKTQYFIKIK